MRKGGGKDKGADYERECARELSKWFTYGNNTEGFWRSGGSGSMGTRRAAKGEADIGPHVGDIVSVAEDTAAFTGQFCVECKRVKTFGWKNVMHLRWSSWLEEFWDQALRQAIQPHRYPFLMAREDRGEEIIGMQRLIFDLRVHGAVDYALIFTWLDLVLVFREEFFNKVSPRRFMGVEEPRRHRARTRLC